MPRCFFHIAGPDGLRDIESMEGSDLPGPKDARADAIELLSEILKDAGDQFRRREGRWIEVVDDLGRVVCGLQLEGWSKPKARLAPGREVADAVGIRLQP